MAIKDFEHTTFETIREVSSLKYEIELKDNEIGSLKKELSTKDKIIGRLQTEKEKLKQELQKFKGFWHSIMNHFHKRICYDKDSNSIRSHRTEESDHDGRRKNACRKTL